MSPYTIQAIKTVVAVARTLQLTALSKLLLLESVPVCLAMTTGTSDAF